ncbi:MAG: BON domain-containing protein [Xanthomonadales bacterium PRO7]|nr:BON domain-containing protein [Xanthomonadales bacterium PRO7]
MKMYKNIMILTLVPLLHGCVAAVAGGVLVGAHAVHDRRAVGTVLSDRNIQLSAIDAINKHRELTRDDNNVKVVVYNGVMLLCGQVRSEALKQLAHDSAEGFDGVIRLVDEIQVTDQPQGFWRRRGDETTTARVKTGLLDITSLPGFDPTRINVTTSHGVVYLMGLVKHDEADAATDVARNTAGVDKVVKVFDYTD